MSNRSYFTWEEQEAYKQGKQDESHHRTDFDHDRFAYDGEDRAYWDGRKDEQDEEERQERQRQEEQQQQEAEEELRYERDRQEERQYQEMIADMQEQERLAFEKGLHEEDSDRQTIRDYDAMNDTQSQDDETPSSERDLFRQIIDDERNDLDI